MAALTKAKLEADYPQREAGASRSTSEIAHGCVRAEFEVLPNLPDALRRGLFAEPRTYRAWIRFSSSSVGPVLKSDAVRDAHRMANQC